MQGNIPKDFQKFITFHFWDFENFGGSIKNFEVNVWEFYIKGPLKR